jgi:hypothetical protein
MAFWIGVGVVLLVVLGLTGLASWRRRGRSDADLLGDQRRDLGENSLRTRSRGQYGR